MKCRERILFTLRAATVAIACIGLQVISASAQDPPVTFLPGDWPWYVQGGIAVEPYPLISSHETEFCAQVKNADDTEHEALLGFYVAEMGVGLPFSPIGEVGILAPPGGITQGCVTWTPPTSGAKSIQVRLMMNGYDDMVRERNLDINENLQPGVPRSREFLVGNPAETTVTINIGLILHLLGWSVELSQDSFPDMGPGEVMSATLTIIPPDDLPQDTVPIVDVEGFIGGEIIGGFREISVAESNGCVIR